MSEELKDVVYSREVRSPCTCRGGARPGSRVTGVPFDIYALLLLLLQLLSGSVEADPVPRHRWPLEGEMATHSSTLAWKIPWMEEPGGLQSMGSLESDTTEQLSISPGESQGRGSLVGCRLWGCTESDTTETT